MWVDYAALTIWHEKGDGIRGGVRVTVTQQRPQDWSAMHTGVGDGLWGNAGARGCPRLPQAGRRRSWGVPLGGGRPGPWTQCPLLHRVRIQLVRAPRAGLLCRRAQDALALGPVLSPLSSLFSLQLILACGLEVLVISLLAAQGGKQCARLEA